MMNPSSYSQITLNHQQVSWIYGESINLHRLGYEVKQKEGRKIYWYPSTTYQLKSKYTPTGTDISDITSAAYLAVRNGTLQGYTALTPSYGVSYKEASWSITLDTFVDPMFRLSRDESDDTWAYPGSYPEYVFNSTDVEVKQATLLLRILDFRPASPNNRKHYTQSHRSAPDQMSAASQYRTRQSPEVVPCYHSNLLESLMHHPLHCLCVA